MLIKCIDINIIIEYYYIQSILNLKKQAYALEQYECSHMHALCEFTYIKLPCLMVYQGHIELPDGHATLHHQNHIHFVWVKAGCV